jgi:hypothetical protein
VPVVALNLPQRYRFDSNGQMVRYDRLPASGAITTVRNIMVHGNDAENLVAAVLVAPGPDKIIAAGNLASPYDTEGPSDDLVVAVSLEAEALKVANHAVSLLQQTAWAFDAIFYRKNNDLDTLYREPQTRWVDITVPNLVMEWIPGGCTRVEVVDGIRQVIPYDCWKETGEYWPNYGSGDVVEDRTLHEYIPGNEIPVTTPIDDGDEYVVPYPLRRPVPVVDEGNNDEMGGKVSAEVKGGSGCVQIAEVGSGLIWSNDPSRGVWSLDNCDVSPAYDLAVAYGLNLAKLGYDAPSNSLLDPWGNPYLWGAASKFSASDRHYWSFYSIGPDGVDRTADDILPTTDRITP